MDEKIVNSLREKIIKRLNLMNEGPPLSDLFSLIQDLNFLLFRLLQELGALSSGGYLSPEILAALLRFEPDDGHRIITLGEDLRGHSDSDLLHGAGLFPLICLHTLPDSLDLIVPANQKKVIPVHQLIEKERIIAILLEQIRVLREKR
ncbi:MAG: hypothetical protein ACE5FZ_09625 [Nitrospiria bacterium]